MSSVKKSLVLQLLIHLPRTHQTLCRPVPSFRHRGVLFCENDYFQWTYTQSKFMCIEDFKRPPNPPWVRACYARKSKRATRAYTDQTYTQNNNYCRFSFIIVIRVANWHISLRDTKSQYFRALVSLFANFEVERSALV